jgi:hypothetical protein
VGEWVALGAEGDADVDAKGDVSVDGYYGTWLAAEKLLRGS